MLHLILSICIAYQPAGTTSVGDGLVTMSNIEFAEIGNQKKHKLSMDVVFPSNSVGSLPVVIFIHGGGWIEGRRQDGLRSIKMFAKGGYFAMTIDYRLAGQGGFPDAVHDCKAAIRFVRKNADELGINPDKIALVGFSAGGYLSTLVGVSSGNNLLDGSINGTDITTEVTCVGSINGTVMPQRAKGIGKKIYEQWALRDKETKLENTLPITYLDKSDPPIYLLCGEEDSICPVELTKEFTGFLETNNIDCKLEIIEGANHLIADPSAYLGLLQFIDKHLGGNSMDVLQKRLDEINVLGTGRN
ncbi:MAG: alpha/beta hydrolase [Phycisphaerales bacterium]|jgi:acetyl esterase/lipase|nr:alpha/beta hydrolase [Phycisphaerales bacterium]